MSNNSKPLVSIITPSLNQGRFIEATIKSVISQDYPNIEYIIIDGGSSDNTLEIIQKYRKHISKWISEPDHGQADAINKGWTLSKGDFVAWLNSDDFYAEGAVATAVKNLSSNPSTGMVFGNANLISIDEKFLGLYTPKHSRSYPIGKPVEYDIPQPTTFIRRTILDQIGYLNTRLDYCMDYEYFMRLSRVSGIDYIPSVLANMRIYPETKSSRNIPRNMQEKLTILKRYDPFWFLSRYWWRYFGYRYLWMNLPEKIRVKYRKIRNAPRDRI